MLELGSLSTEIVGFWYIFLSEKMVLCSCKLRKECQFDEINKRIWVKVYKDGKYGAPCGENCEVDVSGIIDRAPLKSYEHLQLKLNTSKIPLNFSFHLFKLR